MPSATTKTSADEIQLDVGTDERSDDAVTCDCARGEDRIANEEVAVLRDGDAHGFRPLPLVSIRPPTKAVGTVDRQAG